MFKTFQDPELTEDSKLKQRIQRFGEVVSTKAKNLNEKERFEKRKERFGIVNVGDTKSNGNKMNQFNKPVQNESIKKRQDRFGVVENAKPQNKILPVSLSTFTILKYSIFYLF